MGRREVLFIFFLFLIGGAVIFAMGIKVGEYLFENECQAILEQSVKKAPANVEKTEEAAVPAQAPSDEPTQVADTEATKPETTKSAPETKKPEKMEKWEKSSANLGIKEITNEIKNKYTIQISSYQSEMEAQQAAYQLYSSGFKLAYYMESEIPNKGIWYRVGIGFFKKRESARIFAEMLKKQGKVETYIIRKID